MIHLAKRESNRQLHPQRTDIRRHLQAHTVCLRGGRKSHIFDPAHAVALQKSIFSLSVTIESFAMVLTAAAALIASSAFVADNAFLAGRAAKTTRDSYFATYVNQRPDLLLSMALPESNSIAEDDNDNEHESNASNIEANDIETKKSMSPLAMAAHDWLEEEEDELALYWDRFDEKKNDRKKERSETDSSVPSGKAINGVTTEELLGRYYKGRGIDKEEEEKYGQQIRKATESAKRAASAEEAMRVMENVREYLQYNTKLGGNAYFELAEALYANGDKDEALEIHKKLASSLHNDIRRRSRDILSTPPIQRRKRSYKKNVWDLLWDN